ncbi:MAG: hypothetical protein KGJ31_03040 [Patescibacteria group bacterium]|nr:hypothetical protein [Patescibacteria group bacterium]
MAYFARKLRYGAHDGEAGANYIALIELARKKGGAPVGLLLYQRIIQYNFPAENRTEMIRLPAKTAEEAIKRFWHSDEKGEGKEFPGFYSKLWQKTTLWLNHVAVGGGYEGYGYRHDSKGIQPGRWVRVGTPASWSRHRKKKRPLQFGLPAHIILVDQARIRGIEEDIDDLKYKLNELESYDDEGDCNYVPEENQEEYEAIESRVAALRCEIFSIHAKIEALHGKMRSEVRQMFPVPLGLIPKRASRPKPESRHW